MNKQEQRQVNKAIRALKGMMKDFEPLSWIHFQLDETIERLEQFERWEV